MTASGNIRPLWPAKPVILPDNGQFEAFIVMRGAVESLFAHPGAPTVAARIVTL